MPSSNLQDNYRGTEFETSHFTWLLLEIAFNKSSILCSLYRDGMILYKLGYTLVHSY